MGKSRGMKRIDPPPDIAATYLARVGEWKLRFLQGITQSPTLRIDGTVLQEPGYDAASGLLYDPGNVVFPPVRDAPSEAQARAALDVLESPFGAFAFSDEADKSVALAAVLTALVRAMFRRLRSLHSMRRLPEAASRCCLKPSASSPLGTSQQ